MIYLGLKGFGDLAILLSYLIQLNTKQTLVVRSELFDFANRIVGDKHKIERLKNVKDVFPLYSLRKISIKNIYTIFHGYKEIKNIAEKNSDKIVLDINSLRNTILFFWMPKKFLEKEATIYKAYEKHFGLKVDASKIRDGNKKYMLFPKGSLPHKSVTEKEIESVLVKSNIPRKNVTIYLYIKDSEALSSYGNFNVSIFSDVNELIDSMEKIDGVISVDTFQLHLAVLLKKPVLLLGEINTYFVPPFKIKDSTQESAH